jgi:hypothetical protein
MVDERGDWWFWSQSEGRYVRSYTGNGTVLWFRRWLKDQIMAKARSNG